MKRDIKDLMRKNIAGLVPYSSARDEYTGDGAIYLDANENPYNQPYNRYPDPKQNALKEKIGKLKSIQKKNLFLGNGSDEAIDILFRIFCEPGRDNAVQIYPTYGMYRVCADINNVEMINVPLNEDYSLDSDSIIRSCNDHTRLVFICSPNNPTSNSFSPELILEVAQKTDAIVVVDEAYIDFSQRSSLANRIIEVENIVVLQTFSKAWGLAGIRLGMAIAHEEIIDAMTRVKYPYNLNVLTINFAMKALENKEKVEEWKTIILKERLRMEKMMSKFRFVLKTWPSDANFLLVKVIRPTELYTYLVKNEIIVRDRSNVELCDGSLRITVGSPEENNILFDALMEYQRDFVRSCEI